MGLFQPELVMLRVLVDKSMYPEGAGKPAGQQRTVLDVTCDLKSLFTVYDYVCDNSTRKRDEQEPDVYK